MPIFRPFAAAIVFPAFFAAAALFLPAAAGAQGSGGNPYYEVEAVNPGLPDAQGVNLETPQAMMETFLFAAEEENWERAAQALDLSILPAGEQAGRGPELARQMHRVVRRGMWLSWDELSDRPDAVDAHSTNRNPMAGEPRRNIRLALVQVDGRTAPIRIARLKPANGDPRWVFSAQTVENIPEMYERYGPTGLERALPAFLQKTAFWTLAWWEVMALPLLFLAAIAVAAVAFRIIGRQAAKRESELVSGLLRAVRTPAALFVFLAVFAIARDVFFVFSGPVNAVLVPLQTALIVIAVAALILSAIDAVLDRIVREKIDELGDPEAEDQRNFYTTVSAVRRGVVTLIMVGGAALVLIQANISETLGFSLLLSAGVLGLVLVFAARSMLSDLMASLQIALAKTARIGDAVYYDEHWSYVERIGFTHVQLRRWDGRRLIVPVGEFVNNTFENWTKQDPSLLEQVVMHFDHRADIGRLREAFQDFVQSDDDVIEKDDAKVQVIEHSPTGVAVRFLVCASDPSTGWNMHCRLREAMLEAAQKLEAEASPENADRPAYFPREREVYLGGADGKANG